MKIIAVDDEYLGLKALKSAIEKAESSAEVFAFDDPMEALEFAKNGDTDIAFLDIFMPDITGIDLAKQIKLVSPKTHIVFATGFDDYMKDAFQIHANGYVLKPITPEKIAAELENIASYSIQSAKSSKANNSKRLRFQCFGNFEVFVDEKPLHFKYDRTKEMLAFMVTKRGALCSNGEIIVTLWEDDNGHDSYLRGIRKDLLDVFKEKGLEDIINQQRGKIGINVSEVACDYYDFLEGDVNALNSYHGEFMYQYSWGEMINAEIMMK